MFIAVFRVASRTRNNTSPLCICCLSVGVTNNSCLVSRTALEQWWRLQSWPGEQNSSHMSKKPPAHTACLGHCLCLQGPFLPIVGTLSTCIARPSCWFTHRLLIFFDVSIWIYFLLPFRILPCIKIRITKIKLTYFYKSNWETQIFSLENTAVISVHRKAPHSAQTGIKTGGRTCHS